MAAPARASRAPRPPSVPRRLDSRVPRRSAACASTKNEPPTTVVSRPNNVAVQTAGGLNIEALATAEDRSEGATIAAAPDAAWKQLPGVYGDLEIPVNTYVDATRQIAAK